jgi:hypothetical protein
MITGYLKGAMYAKIQPGDKIERTPVKLGDGILKPGEFIQKLGEKKRSNFEMKAGFYLRYVGKVEDYILFNVNDYPDDDYYYAFYYINPTRIAVATSKRSCWDIVIKHLEKIPNPKMAYRQLELDLQRR